jgi:hypothetical protein
MLKQCELSLVQTLTRASWPAALPYGRLADFTELHLPESHQYPQSAAAFVADNFFITYR